MLFRITYVAKNDIQKVTKRAEFVVDSEAEARAEFHKWADKQGFEPKVLMILSVRDVSKEPVTLDVKDTSIDTKGNV